MSTDGFVAYIVKLHSFFDIYFKIDKLAYRCVIVQSSLLNVFSHDLSFVAQNLKFESNMIGLFMIAPTSFLIVEARTIVNMIKMLHLETDPSS